MAETMRLNTSDSDPTANHVGAQPDVVVSRTETPDGPPPACTPTDPNASAAAPERTTEWDDLVNHYSLTRANNAIIGTYVVDPRLDVLPTCIEEPLPGAPQRLSLPAASHPEAKKSNLFLCTANGSISVDLHIVGDAPPASGSGPAGEGKQKEEEEKVEEKKVEEEKVDILMKSVNGAINVKLHASRTLRPAFKLTAVTSNGTITVQLPRSFYGRLTLRTHNGIVEIDDALAKTTNLSGMGREISWSVRPSQNGAASAEGGGGGDEVSLESINGHVKVQYDDETISPGQRVQTLHSQTVVAVQSSFFARMALTVRSFFARTTLTVQSSSNGRTTTTSVTAGPGCCLQ
ncbi:hypothetical protein C8R47DRAFT_1109070 [Mycena vitilis]|nr:hypothetical protein C8R47DRAFT_1109070 [Mycena vitilis]